MLKHFTNAFLFLSDRADDPLVRLAEVEYSQEFVFLQKSLGRRPLRKEVAYILGK